MNKMFTQLNEENQEELSIDDLLAIRESFKLPNPVVEIVSEVRYQAESSIAQDMTDVDQFVLPTPNEVVLEEDEEEEIADDFDDYMEMVEEDVQEVIVDATNETFMETTTNNLDYEAYFK